MLVDKHTARGWHLERIRRLVLTAFLYLVFGAGAGVALVVVLPIVVFSAERRRRVHRVRWVIHHAFKSFTWFGSVLGVFDVSFINSALLAQPGQLIISNHPSLLDVVFLLGAIPNANCVVKKKLLRNPFLAVQVYFADYILNDMGEVLLERCIASLDRGESLIIFPAGTRTVCGQDYKFERGAAYLMLMANCPVRPVYISCKSASLGKKDPWYAVPERKITYCINVLAELDMVGIRQASQPRLPLKSRRVTRWLVDWYHRMDRADLHGYSENPGAVPVSDWKTLSGGAKNT